MAALSNVVVRALYGRYVNPSADAGRRAGDSRQYFVGWRTVLDCAGYVAGVPQHSNRLHQRLH